MRIFINPYDAGEIWATSMGNGLRVGWLTEPRPGFDPLRVSAGTVSYSGWGSDRQHLGIQTSSDFAGWSDLATNIVRDSRFGGADAPVGSGSARFCRAVVASPLTGSSP